MKFRDLKSIAAFKELCSSIKEDSIPVAEKIKKDAKIVGLASKTIFEVAKLTVNAIKTNKPLEITLGESKEVSK